MKVIAAVRSADLANPPQFEDLLTWATMHAETEAGAWREVLQRAVKEAGSPLGILLAPNNNLLPQVGVSTTKFTAPCSGFLEELPDVASEKLGRVRETFSRAQSDRPAVIAEWDVWRVTKERIQILSRRLEARLSKIRAELEKELASALGATNLDAAHRATQYARRRAPLDDDLDEVVRRVPSAGWQSPVIRKLSEELTVYHGLSRFLANQPSEEHDLLLMRTISGSRQMTFRWADWKRVVGFFGGVLRSAAKDELDLVAGQDRSFLLEDLRGRMDCVADCIELLADYRGLPSHALERSAFLDYLLACADIHLATRVDPLYPAEVSLMDRTQVTLVRAALESLARGEKNTQTLHALIGPDREDQEREWSEIQWDLLKDGNQIAEIARVVEAQEGLLLSIGECRVNTSHAAYVRRRRKPNGAAA